ncbi:MAG TPA: NAD-dependent succinate-semialdehyde dehydrogenase [Conexivisphaerales archaeon]|nr:NAD-dependent succinate-semialdehyde dehydrogenase [Conexivisphaerales archaeon]
MSLGEEFWTIDPATGTKLASYTMTETHACLRLAEEADAAFASWRTTPVSDRAELVRSLAGVLRKDRERLARTMSHEMGKPIKQSEAEVDKCAWMAEVMAKEGPGWLADEEVATDAESSLVRFDPLGVIFGVEPWNFPAWQALRFAVPTVMAGNSVLVRPSNVVPASSLILDEDFREAGFPAGVFRVAITAHATVRDVILSPYVKGVSFTGSNGAGSRVAEAAGSRFKKCVLELGGSDPFIVLDDADVPAAAAAGAESRLINSGQSCINAKRFVVIESVYEQFRDLFVKEMQSYIVGDPLDPMTDVGPLARESQLRQLESQVRDAVRKGVKVTCGGKRMGGSGYFFEPTVLENFSIKMKVLHEEVFGPVAPLIRVKDDAEAAEWANATRYGLGASIWSRDADRAASLAGKVAAGVVFVNGLVKSDPRMPFGGVKDSGYGREMSRFGIREFTNVKGLNLCTGTA